LAVFFLLTLGALWAAQTFKIDASADTLLLKNNRLFIETQVMNKRFSPQEFILVAYKPKNNPLFSEKTFADIEQLSEKFRALNRVGTVTNILNVPLLSLAGELNPNLNPDDYTWQNQRYSADKMREVFKQHPLFTDLLVNSKQTATAMQIVFKPNPQLLKIQNQITDLQAKFLNNSLTKQDQQHINELKKQAEPIEEKLKEVRQQEIKQIYQITADYQQDANLFLGGSYVIGQQLVAIVKNDLRVFGSAISLAICVLLLLLFRRIRWVVLPVLCCAVSVILTIGLFSILDLRATVISSNFVTLQIILTLAIVIHLIVEFRQLAEITPDATQNSILLKTFTNKFKPCLYAGITTSVGFASLIFSGIQPVISFGWMMIVAMIISIASSLLLFPSFLTLFSRQSESSLQNINRIIIRFFSHCSLNYNKLIVVVSIVVVIISVLGLFRLQVENSFLNYFKESTQVREELSFIDQEFGGSTPLDLVYSIDEKEKKPDLLLSAKTVQSLQKIQHVLRQYEATGNITSVVNFTELARQINHGQPLTEYELSVIYTLLDNELKEQLLGAYFDPDTSQLRISMRIQDSTPGFNRADFLATLKKDLEGLGLQQENYSLTNLFVLYQDILQRLFSSQIMTLGLVFIALTLVLFGVFKSIKVALITVIPNILTTIIILGIMGWLHIPLDLMTITISAIAMGIAVDDTIHFTHRYLEQRQTEDVQQATINTFNSVGYAMLYTTVIVTIGFSLLSFSDFVPSMVFGLLTGLAMLLALLTDSTLLPVLLNRFVASPNKQ
tara:strand:- start:4182 stop:6533 length:2352 start_codon:yes stop_codon:yes gene_type:complete